MEEKKDKKPAPVCKCGKTAKHHVYSTFEYFYCSDCKAEVKEEEKKPKRPLIWTDVPIDHGGGLLQGFTTYSFPMGVAYPPQPLMPALPPGIVALKGEKVTCSLCGAVNGQISVDLVYIHPFRDLFNSLNNHVPGCLCPYVAKRRHNLAYGCDEVHVEGRGWV